jgi:hypothetical protein
MSITLDLPLEIEQKFAAEAQELGVPLGDFIRDLLISREADEISGRPQAERVDYWLDSIAAITPSDGPSLSDDAMRRESIYSREGD